MSVRALRHDRPSGRFSKSFLPHPLSALSLVPFFARSLTLVRIPRSLLLNRTETLATQAKKDKATFMNENIAIELS